MTSPFFLTLVSVIFGGAILGAIFSLMAVGLNLQYGVSRILNIAIGDFLMVGAYITFFFFTTYGVNPLVSLAISGPIVFGIGILLQATVFRRIVRLSKSTEQLEMTSLLACFALPFIIENIVGVIFGGNVIGAPYLTTSVNVLGAMLQENMVVAAFMSIIIGLVMYLVLRFASIGLAMRAIAEEPTGAQLVGINIFKVHAVSFGIGALFAGLAGSMLVMIYSNITPYVGPYWTCIALGVIIVGGMGSFIGSLIGGFLIGYAYYISLVVNPLLTLAVVYSFIIVVLIVRPKGFFGR